MPDSLTRFPNEADILEMSEPQAFIALLNFLADPAETQSCTNLSRGPRRGGITRWPDAIQCTLGIYVTAAAMRGSLESLRNIRRTSTEAEEDYR